MDVNKNLILNNNYRIKYEENNCVLQYFEKREREKKDGTKEQYEFTSDWYYPNVRGCLRKFLQLNLEGSESINQVLERITEVEQIIKKIK